MSKSDKTSEDRQDTRDEIKDALHSIRQEMEKVGRDLQTIVDSTRKYVETKTPVVSATIVDSMERASEEFKKMMSNLDHQTRPQQARLLQNYKSFLERQLVAVEKRISEITEKKSTE